MGTSHSLLSSNTSTNAGKSSDNSNMAQDEEDMFSWVFESLVGFLKGPLWETAVLSYIEQKSIVFDPVGGDEAEYKKLHEEYKNLVDTMLSSHMEDLGISPDEFQKACRETEKLIHSQFRKSLFEQLWATDDYEIFKRMMTQKNLELQLQALDLLAHQYGLLPESFMPGDDYEPSSEERTIMETVMKRYVEENLDQEHISENTEPKVIQETKAQLELERNREMKLMEKAMESSLQTAPKIEVQSPPEMIKKTGVTPEEAKKRQEYLMQQRDKLLALKKQEREKMLQKYEGKTGRPKSAKAAQKAVKEEMSDPTDSNVQAFRNSLAARLKAEVIDQK